MAWHPQTGDLYVSEHGPFRYDEINRVLPGRDYGWGRYKCDEQILKTGESGSVVDPVVCFKHWNISPSGMTFVSDPASPWFGSLFVASLRGRHLHRYVLDGDEVVVDEIFYVSDGWRYEAERGLGKLSRQLRDVEFWNGSLYVIGESFGLARLDPLSE